MTAVMFIDDWNEEKFGGIIHQYRGETKVWLAWRHSTEDVYVKINCWLIDYWYDYLSIV